MEDSSRAHCVLVAAPAAVLRELRGLLQPPHEVLGVLSSDEAKTWLSRLVPDVVVVCYVLDEMRPYRLIRYIREEWQGPRVPLLLVHAVPVPLGAAEQEVRESYAAIGVDQFVDLAAAIKQAGVAEARRRLVEAVTELIAKGPRIDRRSAADERRAAPTQVGEERRGGFDRRSETLVR